jgi:hypothetical protein
MLLAANLGEEFWSLAVEAANHVRNRSPHKATPGNKPPYALLRGCKPNITHLQIFGCVCYPILDLASRSTFKSNVVKGVFMGYEPLSRAYRVYFPDTGKLRVYRDVIFNEMPLLANLKRRHTLLLEELEEWPEQAAHEHPTPVVPAPARAHPHSASFPNKHVSFPTPPSSLSNYRTQIGRKKKILDLFDSDSDDDDAPIAYVRVAHAPVSPVLPSPVAPVLSSPVFSIDNHPNSDSEAS